MHGVCMHGVWCMVYVCMHGVWCMVYACMHVVCMYVCMLYVWCMHVVCMVYVCSMYGVCMHACMSFCIDRKSIFSRLAFGLLFCCCPFVPFIFACCSWHVHFGLCEFR